ncbi:hypothetical protein HOD75_02480 [archaeon]|jgi:hypothetical protein|nr:hypothetical protein [archaeon]MBT4241745.1 hypothetical protein [archaeon]MBT4418293.1 hypothetical protein [archaeon]
MGRLKNWREVIDTDFPEMGPITEESIAFIRKYGHRFYCSDVRIATGRIMTDSSYEARRKEILETPLP